MHGQSSVGLLYGGIKGSKMSNPQVLKARGTGYIKFLVLAPSYPPAHFPLENCHWQQVITFIFEVPSWFKLFMFYNFKIEATIFCP
jgi:hypothetical protein